MNTSLHTFKTLYKKNYQLYKSGQDFQTPNYRFTLTDTLLSLVFALLVKNIPLIPSVQYFFQFIILIYLVTLGYSFLVKGHMSFLRIYLIVWISTFRVFRSLIAVRFAKHKAEQLINCSWHGIVTIWKKRDKVLLVI
jgi:hypothetical protein